MQCAGVRPGTRSFGCARYGARERCAHLLNPQNVDVGWELVIDAALERVWRDRRREIEVRDLGQRMKAFFTEQFASSGSPKPDSTVRHSYGSKCGPDKIGPVIG